MQGCNVSFCFVSVAPLLSVIPDNRRITVGRNISWRCKANADPPASFKWQKGGIDVAESDRISISRDGSELSIDTLHPDDAGLYTCFAINYLGNDKASAQLVVIGMHSRVFSL